MDSEDRHPDERPPAGLATGSNGSCSSSNATAAAETGDSTSTRTARPRSKAKAVKKRRTVLVVDDDPHFRELYRAALRFEGFSVVTASDGLGALQAIESEAPSIVILDLNMPCVDGWSVLGELASNESTKAIPVIVVTAADVTRAVGRAVAILKKPVFPDELLPLIERYIESPA